MAPDTVPDLLVHAGTRFAHDVALVDVDRSWTFAALADEAQQVAASLVALGVRRGDRVGIWAPNGATWVLAALGAACAGAVLVPVNTRAKGREAAELFARARCRLLFATRGFLDTDGPAMLAASGVALADLGHVVLLAGEAAGDAPLAPELDWPAFAAVAAGERVRVAVDPDDVTHVQFTSGTTGAPKAAMLRHRALCGTTRDWVANVGLRRGDRYLVVSPMFHVSGHKTGVLACLTAGATILPQAVFEPESVMARVEREHVTVLPGPPTIYQSLLASPNRASYDLSSLRLAVTGAASIPAVLVERMRDELGFEVVITAYGTTETTGVVTMCRPGDDVRTIAETSGRAVDGVEVAIVDEHGRAQPAGGSGEIVVRGYNVMAGYLDDPAATAAAIDTQGWFHTGDVGWLDAAGNLRITDRLGDVFIVGGFNAYPAEIEGQMLRHPAVGAVAVVGVDDERLGEVGHAFVVPRPGVAADPAEIVAWCRAEMANYKVPRQVELVDELPLNASGKVLKHVLRDRARAVKERA